MGSTMRTAVKDCDNISPAIGRKSPYLIATSWLGSFESQKKIEVEMKRQRRRGYMSEVKSTATEATVS